MVMKRSSIQAIGIATGSVLVTALLGSWATRKGIDSGWYETVRPSMAPPNVVFPIVWSILYLLIIVGFTRTLMRPDSWHTLNMLIIANLVLNVVWCTMFFWWQKVGAAMAVIVALWVISVMMVWMGRGDWLLLTCFAPVALWISFAAVLNASVVHQGNWQGTGDHYVEFAAADSTGSTGSGCHFHADAGMVCPVRLATAPAYTVHVYQDVSPFIQEQVVAHLGREWGYSRDFVETHWASGTGDIMYVMVSTETGMLLGTVAVDRKTFYPYISQLYVVPEARGRGYAKVLLAMAEEHTRRLGFDSARIWCTSALVPWYTKQGWVVEPEGSVPPKQILMAKRLI